MKIKRYFLVIFSILFSFVFSFAITAEINTKTPIEDEIISNLQKRCVVFLCFNNAADPDFAAIKDNLNSVEDSFSGAVNVIYVSSDDIREEKLREKFEMSSKTTTVFIIVPPGRTVAKLEGSDITKANLMRVLYASCGGGSCSPSGCR